MDFNICNGILHGHMQKVYTKLPAYEWRIFAYDFLSPLVMQRADVADEVKPNVSEEIREDICGKVGGDVLEANLIDLS